MRTKRRSVNFHFVHFDFLRVKVYLVRAALLWMHPLPSGRKTMPTTTAITMIISANRRNGCKRTQLNELLLSDFLSTAAVFFLITTIGWRNDHLAIVALNAFRFSSGASVRVSVIRLSFSMLLSRVDQSKGGREATNTRITKAHKWRLHWPVRWWLTGSDRLWLLLLYKIPCRNNGQSEES